jgi:hypothetical protein
MNSKKLRNISYSLVLLIVCTSIILLLAVRNNVNPGDISAIYVGAKLTGIIAAIGSLLLIGLRIFNVIDKNRNFLYSFIGTTNFALSLYAIGFYLSGKINMIGLHDSLPNLFIGIIIYADIFLFELIFHKKTE